LARAAAPPPPRSLLERRLVIVTGKGGTGKTTVVAALALAAARAGLRVLVAETTRDQHLPRLLAGECQLLGEAKGAPGPGIRALRIDPFEALAEYLGLQIGVRGLVGLVLRNRGFRQLMGAAPGWRDLITLGKVWHLEQMRDGERPLYDLIVVDAPATGHGVTFLDVPRVVVSAVRAGPLRRHAGYVEAMIEDSERTLLLPVALAEELPARETAELVERLRDAISIAVDRVVVNGVVGAPFPPDLADLDERLARLPDAPLATGLPTPRELAACARHLRARHELNEGYVGEIARLTGLPIVRLPYLTRGINGPDDVGALADPLLEAPRWEAA
jgi:anion-transporting  ArsA/GET3 family ATPase